MPKPKTNPKRNKQKKNKTGIRAEGPVIGATTYTGPSLMPERMVREDETVVQLGAAVNITTTAGGAYTAVFKSDPTDYDASGTDITDWTTWNQLYDQYRVLAITLEYCPRSPYLFSAATTLLNLLVAADYNDATVPTNVTDIVNFPSVKLLPAWTTWKYKKWRAGTPELMLYQSTGTSPSYIGSVKVINVQTASGAVSFGSFLFRMLIQLKGRK